MNGWIEKPISAPVLTALSRSLPGRRPANTPRARPMLMPNTEATAPRRSVLTNASLRFGHTGRLPLMLGCQSPVRNPPSHWK